jgi:hypothetical protein
VGFLSTWRLKLALGVEIGIYLDRVYGIIMSKLAQELGHLKNHVTYPASRSQVVAACSDMSDLPAEDRDWVAKNLPEGNYRTPAEVMTALLARA